MWDEDKEVHERELKFALHGGAASALEAAGAQARRSAGLAFEQNQDVKAELWRQVAVWLESLGLDSRKTQKCYEKVISFGV